ncbi:metallophosphoesterase family protein [Oceanobacillus chungangensis]|uniref:DNA repair exonuclease n=1 Tax=Oceanobacillus chungangensis TaxID=1229152 RepID=A0A3D8PVV0_9BACI|nr:DNA repair exonuclease [Oceanobacillus chungangensis]RDW19882.1 DNA repair exonuclease [Oceanobacillus chungangensis]
MGMQISFIHAADLHLDSPFKGLTSTPDEIFKEIRESTFIALERLVENAIEKQVDFVLIVGDLFDNESQSLKAQVRLRRAFEQLNQYNINVYLSYGNHDFISGNRFPIEYPENVYIFQDGEVTSFTYEKEGKPIAEIYGFSYINRAVLDPKATEFKISHHHIPFHIAMLHGSIQSNSEHDVYAPFKLSDLQEEGFDYWALGHIHKREILKERPNIVYPGNIQGRNRKETGEKGCYHVVLTESKTEMSFIPLQAIEFKSLTIDVSDCQTVDQIEAIIQEDLQQQEPTTPQLINLTLTSHQAKVKQWESENLLEEIIELINEASVNHHNWFYIFNLSVTISSLGASELEGGEHFIGELVRHADKMQDYPFLKELYRHKQARKYLERLSDEEEQLLRSQAKQLLLNELLKG